MEIPDKIVAGIGTVAILGALIYGFAYQIPRQKRERRRLEEKFRSAEVLQGKIIDESFDEGHSGGICASDVKDRYRMKVILSDSSHRIFRYVGSKAEEMYEEHKEGDIVTFKDGFKPEDKY